MTKCDFDKHVADFHEEMLAITSVKNTDYSAGHADAMANYYELSNASGVTPFQAWMCLFMKHVTAIMRYAKTGSVLSESIHGRMLDVANYAVLGDALIKDMAAKESK